MTINLTDGINNSFTFSGEINGKVHTYEAFYPTAKQLRPIQLGYAKLQELDKKATKLEEDDLEGKEKLSKEVETISNEMVEAFSQLFKPLEDSMPISDFIDNLPAPAKKNFDNMIQKELMAN